MSSPDPAAATPPLLALRDLTCRVEGALVLAGIQFDLAEGECVGLIGPSGAGKTVLFDAICGLLPTSGGHVDFAGRALAGRPAAIARRGIGRSFQVPSPMPGGTVFESLVLAAAIAEGFGLATLWLRARSPLRRHRQAAWTLMRTVGLEAFADHPPTGLPHVLRRQLDLARALAGAPRLLLLDQPLRGFSTSERARLRTVIERLRADRLTILLAEHDIAFVAELCPRVVVLDHGRVLADGTPEEVGGDPAVLQAFVGSAGR